MFVLCCINARKKINLLLVYMGNYFGLPSYLSFDNDSDNSTLPKFKKSNSKSTLKTETDILGTTHVVKNVTSSSSPNIGLTGILSGGGKIKYGIKNGKLVKLYPHKLQKKLGKHKSYISWKTTRKNLPGKTFHGKFYKSKKDAIKKRIKTKKRIQKGGRWYDTTPEETSNINMTPLGYSAIRDIAFDYKYKFNPHQQGGRSRKNKIGRGVQFKRLVRYSNDLPNN